MLSGSTICSKLIINWIFWNAYKPRPLKKELYLFTLPYPLPLWTHRIFLQLFSAALGCRKYCELQTCFMLPCLLLCLPGRVTTHRQWHRQAKTLMHQLLVSSTFTVKLIYRFQSTPKSIDTSLGLHTVGLHDHCGKMWYFTFVANSSKPYNNLIVVAPMASTDWRQGIHRHQTPARYRNAASGSRLKVQPSTHRHAAHYDQTWRHP